MLVGGVVDEDVDAAEFGHRRVDQSPAELLLPDVAGHPHRAASRLFDEFGGPLAVLVLLVEIGQDDVGTLPREGDRDRPSDTGVTTGDQGAAAFEPSAPPVGRLAVVGGGEQIGGRAGVGDLRLLLERRNRVLLSRVLHAVLVLVRHRRPPSIGS